MEYLLIPVRIFPNLSSTKFTWERLFIGTFVGMLSTCIGHCTGTRRMGLTNRSAKWVLKRAFKFTNRISYQSTYVLKRGSRDGKVSENGFISYSKMVRSNG